LPTNTAIGLTIVLNQGGTAYLPNAVQIGGVAQTITWLGGVTPNGNPNKTDIISYSIMNRNFVYTTFAQLISFG